jgi:hypothetical protein
VFQFTRFVNGQTLDADDLNELQIALEKHAKVGASFVFDGLGVAIAAGSKAEVGIAFDGTITGWTVVADRVGSIVCTVNRATYANYPTFTAISGTEKPTLASAQKNQDLTLTTWTPTVVAGDTLQLSVDSAATVQRVTVTLQITRSF